MIVYVSYLISFDCMPTWWCQWTEFNWIHFINLIYMYIMLYLINCVWEEKKNNYDKLNEFTCLTYWCYIIIIHSIFVCGLDTIENMQKQTNWYNYRIQLPNTVTKILYVWCISNRAFFLVWIIVKYYLKLYIILPNITYNIIHNKFTQDVYCLKRFTRDYTDGTLKNEWW